MKKIIIYILTIILLLGSKTSLAKDVDKTLIIILDNVSLSDFENIDRENYGIGLMNLKVRNSNSKKDILTSINVGRKIRFNDIDKENIKLNYLGNTFQNKIAYFGDENSDLKYLVMNDKKEFKNIDKSPTSENIRANFKENQVLAVEFDIREKSNVRAINEMIKSNSKENIYIISTTPNKDKSSVFNRGLGPVMVSHSDGVLTSQSTKRLGLITMEDINFDIRNKNHEETSRTDIGKTIEVKADEDSYGFIKEFNNKTNQLTFISYVLHGVTYLSIALLCLSLYFKKYEKYAMVFFIFNINNILLSLLLSLTIFTNNMMFYLVIITFMNTFFTKSLLKNIDGYKVIVSLTYIIIIISAFFNFDIIYDSFVGFNSLMYGVRYYGINNAMAGVILGLSVLIMDAAYNSKLTSLRKNIIILVLNILNILVLSANYGANTGGFLTALVLLGLSSYTYIFAKKISLKNIIYTLIFAALLLGLNLYLDSLDNTKSHALQFFMRIKENGFGEFYYIVLFKLKELIKFTLMPPFSIVILSEFLIIKKLKNNIDISFKLILMTSILGFLINDTGNVLLIYMLNYGLLLLVYREIKEKNIQLDLNRGGKTC